MPDPTDDYSHIDPNLRNNSICNSLLGKNPGPVPHSQSNFEPMPKFMRPTLNKNSTRSKGTMHNSATKFISKDKQMMQSQAETKVNLETINKDIL
mmetsp:Transcript_21608/g.33261  ORF Transcript_21608/g.33261 Transcript_21608/m.33261 type:complete len:95 (-) Transcript_21608:425-709(-)